MSIKIPAFFLGKIEGMKDYLDDFRMNMKYYREKAGLSQTHLSVLCGCGTGTIGGLEAGRAKPSFDMMVKIADALGISPSDFFVRDSSMARAALKDSLRVQFDSILAKV